MVTITNDDDFEKDIPEKRKKPNQSRKQNAAVVCGDDDEENEDDESNACDKGSELSERDKSNDEEEDYENIS